MTDFYYTYIIECKNPASPSSTCLYTGYSNNPWERFELHKSGRGAKFTKSHPPIRLVFIERHKTKGAAMRRELLIKRLSKEQKLQLIANELSEGERIL